MKDTEYFVSLSTSVFLTEECNVMVNSEELIGTTGYLTLQTKCRINGCRCKREQLYFNKICRNAVGMLAYSFPRKIILLTYITLLMSKKVSALN
jgi:hypothetical protein